VDPKLWSSEAMNRFLSRLGPPARRIDEVMPSNRARENPPESIKIDLDDQCRRDYFAAGGYTAPNRNRPEPKDVRAPDRNERLETWVVSELARVGLSASLRDCVVCLAAIAIKKGRGAAGEAMRADLSIAERDHFAISGILRSIPPLV
jgi:hypothetical protein